ncbi:hypothetical protein INT43_005050 [Umbelopsis isabellina]|uniref:Uncharacterized protein n=1 Tax=Mortierella isabellina TaxID=91625 RepID=A0A8H7U9R7_MORIS|nr:hypothetical protein INT43_005050 [Umbelopsis isabellina]
MEPNKAAHDLAQVRKLIEGMNALVNSQSHLQQQKSEPEEPVPTVSHESTPTINQSATTLTDTSNSLYNMSQLTTPLNAIIVEVNHLVYNRTLFFSLTPDATIEPLITWLRLSFEDPHISGMVLQYKGQDSLWKCLLNRDDSLRRVLKQTLKANLILQLRVPREQDLLSSGYTDKRLLQLTTKP